ncbi:origin of replication complex subunit 4-like isoform X1 [Chenopodium quinoa]|uniref:origin of replication complex subunit 4-like isoform X1 n=2 Tax=Chenopodium quinoa TaxID=63459 RepID=UPI000B77FEFD|nr:origin of replication complex subunit 4-like isoform X1 [Chenopodium quinoa]
MVVVGASDGSVLELYVLVCMKRLEIKEQNPYKFNSVMKEYKDTHDSFQTPGYYARNVCLWLDKFIPKRSAMDFDYAHYTLHFSSSCCCCSASALLFCFRATVQLLHYFLLNSCHKCMGFGEQ